MPGFLVLVVLAFIAFLVFGFAVHLLFSPWLLLAAVAVLAWMKFRPRGSRQ